MNGSEDRTLDPSRPRNWRCYTHNHHTFISIPCKVRLQLGPSRRKVKVVGLRHSGTHSGGCFIEFETDSYLQVLSLSSPACGLTAGERNAVTGPPSGDGRGSPCRSLRPFGWRVLRNEPSLVPCAEAVAVFTTRQRVETLLAVPLCPSVLTVPEPIHDEPAGSADGIDTRLCI